ncbi:hypothetical protein KFE25_000796 [Diacronema lutheri]|uniref:ATP phosphoribosyltransferase n=2 Tax=Diacronema lutheri TaxID=2081491 RepID=A0A8J6CF02_DIALT|nr:hypothetical protein KFE25_000796 [Diacronema lutheri]
MAPILRRLLPSEVPVLRRDPVDPAARDVAAPIVEAVKARGIDAVREYAEKFGELKPGEPLIYTRPELEQAWNKLEPATQRLLVRTVHRVRRFALVQKAAITDAKLDIPGGAAGHTVAPVENAGCYAPGGRYPLPSSIIMTVTTARVAGCTNVWAASPRPTQITLGAAFVAGADAVLAAGGAHAIAALAYGCGPIGPADAVVGPGNQYVTAAKSLIAGRVAIDMLAGPSECLVIADATACARVVAADLLAQAEHDPQALPSLVSTSAQLIDDVEVELVAQLAVLPTAGIAREACKNGYAVLVGSMDEAIAISDRLAPEHLELHTDDAEAVARRCKHYGGLFVGHAAAEVLGDYGAGPNHTLPTGGTARSTGGLSVFTFLRVRTWMSLSNLKTAADLVRDAHALAKIEGLHGHAVAAAHRLDTEDSQMLLEGFESAEGALTAHSAGVPQSALDGASISTDGGASTSGNMLLALPKKGRLAEMCLKFVEAAGLQYHRRDRLDVAHCTNLPITLVFLPAKDIASFIGMGNVDAGITGQDMVAEAGCTVTTELELGIGKCFLSLQVPERKKACSATDFAGCRIATSFPHLTRSFFAPIDKQLGVETKITDISGSVEAAVGLGLADAVVDLVETGTTMRAAGLCVAENLMQTQAVLISNPHTTHATLVNKIRQRFEGYLTSSKYSLMTYNIPRTLLSKAVLVTPGKRSPTVQQLDEDSWVAVSVMVETKQTSDVMDKLKELGATDILLLSLSNCRS